MKNIIHLYNETFKVNYYVTLSKDYLTYKKLVKKTLKIDIEDKRNLTGGNTRVYECDAGEIIWIWISKKEYLIHECIHAACYSLRSKGIEISEDNGEEIMCYLVDWLISKIKL